MTGNVAQEIAALENDAAIAATAGQVAVIAADAAVVLAETQAAVVTAQAAEIIGDVIETVKENEGETEWLKSRVNSLESAMTQQTEMITRLELSMQAMAAAISQASPSQVSQTSQDSQSEVTIPLSEVAVVPLEVVTETGSPAPKEKKRHHLL